MTQKVVKWKDIVSGARKIKKNVEDKQEEKNLPGLGKGETLYVLARAVKYPGKDVTIPKNYKSCPECTGTGIAHNFTKAEYIKVADKVLTWFKSYVNAPNYIIWGKEKLSVRLANFGFSKIIVFYADNKKTMPNTCWMANSVFYKEQSSKKGKTAIIEKATGVKITDYKTLYKAMYEFGYDYYYEDHQTFDETIKRMRGNCVDLNQVEYASLVEQYGKDNVRIVRGVVQCSDGQYGHVWCQIKVGGKWIDIDASASAKGKPLGTVICARVIEITAINPAWAVNDTGDA